MESNEEKYKTAYFNDYSDRCEMKFLLKTELPEHGVLCEEVSALRQSSDSISSLITHIKHKLQKILLDKRIESGKEIAENLKIAEIPVALKRGKKQINGNMVLKNFRTSLINETKEHVVFEVFDQRYIIAVNFPLIKQLKLPSILYANFSVQPVKFHTVFTQSNMSKFIWYKSLDKMTWKECGKGFHYQMTMEDVDHYLKLICTPVSNEVEGVPMEVISESKVEVMNEIPRCPFEKRHDFTKEKLGGTEFRIVSYNVLADRYTQIDENFAYCNPKFLAIDYRKQLILKELLGFNADIICLQEVDNSQYVTYFKKKFEENGYKSLYHKKGNKIPEGLACVYNKTRYKLIESKHIVYGVDINRQKIFSYLKKVVERNEDIRNTFQKIATSLQVTVLKTKDRKQYSIVANTHLYYHPDASHVRLLQINMATAYVNMLRRRYENNQNDVTVIFCGDFNSRPQSSLFRYMIEGKITPSHEDCLKINENGRVLLYHEFVLESASGTPKYTNYTPDFKECLDYVFIESNKLSVQQVVPLTEEEELAKHEGLPNEYFPSDHLPLVIDLKLKGK